MRSLINVVEQLHREFGAARARTEILTVTDLYRDQLDSAPVGTEPELLEHLSRQRLLGSSGLRDLSDRRLTRGVAAADGPTSPLRSRPALTGRA